MNIPTELKYAKTDEWVKVEGNTATVGITDYAQSQLSDIIYVSFEVGVGDVVSKDDVVVSVESVKAAAEANAPVSGKVLELNDALSKTPEQVNVDPFGVAWMVKLEIADAGELDSLMDAASYEKYCQERSH